MKIGGVTLCFNESNMVKYVMPYWERIAIDKLIVYDNMSTDNTVELLSKYPFVEVRTFDTGGKFDDATNSRLKNETILELKSEGYDWVYAGDFDEVIYSLNPNFREELQKIENLGGNVFIRDMVHPFSPDPFLFDSNKLIHEQCSHFLTWHDYTHKWGGSKMLFHKTSDVDGVKYALGAHSCSIRHKSNDLLIFGYPFIAFHLKFVDFNALKEKSPLNHDRIQWRTYEEKASIPTIKHLRRHYSETSSDTGIDAKIKRLVSKCDRVNVRFWNEFMEHYNSEKFLVSTKKFVDIPGINYIDYSTVDMSKFV